MKTVADRLTYLIDNLQIKKKDFAEAIGVSTGNVSDWCSGRSKPSYNALKKIEAAYNISLEWLIEGRGEMQSATSNTRNDEKLTPQEKHILALFRSLSPEEQLKVEGILEYKAAEAASKKQQESSHSQKIPDNTNLLA